MGERCMKLISLIFIEHLVLYKKSNQTIINVNENDTATKKNT